MIRAMFFDLDGTLLNAEKRVPDSALNALRQCRQRDIRLFVATARPPLLGKMLDWAEAEPLFDGGVFCNGACTVIDGEKRYVCIPPAVVRGAVALVNGFDGLNIALQMTEEEQAFRLPLADYAFAKWGLKPEEAKPVDETCLARTVKMMIFYENLIDSVTLLPQALLDGLNRLCAGRARMYVTDGGMVVQIGSAEASKYAGVERVRRALALTRDEVAVFGDDVNDLEMLRGYRHSVAMGNAAPEVQVAAERVTDDCESDGIAHGIEWQMENRMGES